MLVAKHSEEQRDCRPSGHGVYVGIGANVAVKKKELEQFRSMLLELKRKLTNNIGHLHNGALRTGGEAGDELSDVTAEHMADRGSDNFAQDLMVRILQDCDAEVCDINLALQKIEEGTYGLCENCGNSVSRKRLRALPFARLCIECKQEEERRGARAS
jgi:RNA polymerase-binding protein DksA